MPFNVFTVKGRRRYNGDLLVCGTLKFKKDALRGESKLIIVPTTGVPKPGAKDAPRVLKIVANKIDLRDAWDSKSKKGVAEITYDLDGDLLRRLDPENPAKDGDKGKNGMYGKPNFGILAKPGNYPVASDGGHGQHGGRGGKGEKGQDAPILEIWVHKVEGKELTIDLRGQQGGKGGEGGRGGKGGNGQKGANASMGIGETWIGVPTASCRRGPGRGGDGGDGGNAGWGGDGGNGGNGGVVKIFATTIGGADFSSWHFDLKGGKGGLSGAGGKPGKGGKPGAPGKALGCPPAPNAQPGEDGMPVGKMVNPEGKPQWTPTPGQPGAKGYKRTTWIKILPKFLP